MINDSTNFTIYGIDSVIQIDENIYPNGKVVYGERLCTHELIFRSCGEATINFNGKLYHTFPNSIIFLPKGDQKHYSVVFDKPDKFIDIFFHANMPIHDEPIVFDMSHTGATTEMLFHHCQTIWTQKNPGYRSKCVSIIWDILYQIQRNDFYLPNSTYSKIAPAIKYIEENFRLPDISVETLAEMCDISYCYFLQIFKMKYNTTPKKYLIQLKINHSCDLMNRQEYNIKQIAFLSGFNDIYFFSRQFKKIMGVTPTEFRKRLNQNKERFNIIKEHEVID